MIVWGVCNHFTGIFMILREIWHPCFISAVLQHKKNAYRCIQKLEMAGGLEEEYRKVVQGFDRLRILYMKEAGMRERLIRTKKMHKVWGVNNKLIMEFKKEIEREAKVWKNL